MSKRVISAGFVSLAVLLAGCGGKPDAANQSDKITVEGGQAALPAGPAPAEAHGQDFVSAVLDSYDFVLASARAASERADNADVKQFAAKLTTDIGTSRNRLAQLAQTSGLKAEPGASHGTELALISSTRGRPLETLFIDQQTKTLSELVGLVRAYKNGGDNAELKRWAEADQSVINDRLLDLQTLKAQVEERGGK
jgi:putative membrane protein